MNGSWSKRHTSPLPGRNKRIRFVRPSRELYDGRTDGRPRDRERSGPPKGQSSVSFSKASTADAHPDMSCGGINSERVSLICSIHEEKKAAESHEIPTNSIGGRLIPTMGQLEWLLPVEVGRLDLLNSLGVQVCLRQLLGQLEFESNSPFPPDVSQPQTCQLLKDEATWKKETSHRGKLILLSTDSSSITAATMIITFNKFHSD